MGKPRALLLGLALWMAGSASAAQITVESLLKEMVDRDAMARFPDPAYTCRQFSSYDRAKKTPADPKGWFANGDSDKYLRTETTGGRKEFVMADADGPGAVVRLWSANPPAGCKLRFYLDGADEPAWTVDFQELTNGKGFLKPPLSAICSSGWNDYLPVTYAKHCKITSDKRGFYYHVNYRTYPTGTDAESFTPAVLERAKSVIDETQAALLNERVILDEAEVAKAVNGKTPHVILPGEDYAPVVTTPAGAGGVLRECGLKVTADDRAAALRALVIEMTFDGERCVWCPVSDFFGSGVGVNAYHDWYRTVAADGTMTCRWLMPFKETCKIVLHNLGRQPVTVSGHSTASPWAWDDRSMHFHATWHYDYPIPTRPMSDWNYVSVTGQGVYVGDALAVFNPLTGWWGEGDEKVYVDGETFPSHMGTGTEDYYGYAWCDPHLFTHPFHAESRCDGPGFSGHTTVTRSRCLDAIPFTKDLRFDMEIWHWQDCKECYACTTYWYAKPGATTNRVPQPEGATAPILVLPPAKHLDGAIEAETMKIKAKSDGLTTEAQDMTPFGGDWSGGKQLFVHGRQKGDFVELIIPAKDAAAHHVTVYATRSYDYGTVQFSVNGQAAGDPHDLFAEKVEATGAIDLGEFKAVDGAYVLRVEVVGKNDKARGSGSFFGVDAVVVK
jgi:hypothetical protein